MEECILTAQVEKFCVLFEKSPSTDFLRRLFRETWKATAMVVKFMALAFFLKALITLYVPSEWIASLPWHF